MRPLALVADPEIIGHFETQHGNEHVSIRAVSIQGITTMSSFVFFLIPVGVAATAIMLGLGIYSLAKGGTFAKENGNKLMRYRVAAQAITIAVMMLFLALVGSGAGS